MGKETPVLIPLLAITIVFLLGYGGFGWKNDLENKEVASIIEFFTTYSTVSDPLKSEAWQIFENYLEFAHAHNIEGIRSLSHQMSTTCQDPSKQTECFALMDSVYSFGIIFQAGDFKHVQVDERQIIMSTDGPGVAVLYFTRDQNGTPKVLGMRLCTEDVPGECVESDPSKRDLDGNGWWDEVESLFY